MSKEGREITLKDIHNDLVELLKWTKFSGMKEVKPILLQKMENDTKVLIYDLSDSTKGTRDIAQSVGNVSHMTVGNYWQEWEKVGLGRYVVVGGKNRFQKSFDLKDFGIKIPELPKQEKQSASESIQSEERSTTEVKSDDK